MTDKDKVQMGYPIDSAWLESIGKGLAWENVTKAKTNSAGRALLEIAPRIKAMEEENKRLRLFAQNMLEGWPGLNTELDAMREAIMQLLDDMGPNSKSVSEAAKQMALKAVRAHYCPDFYYKPLCASDPEMEGCTCGSPTSEVTGLGRAD